MRNQIQPIEKPPDANYLDVVDAERAALDAERQDAQLCAQRSVSTILLAKALGDGWKQP